MKNTGLFVILIFRRKTFEKSTCFLLAGLYICWYDNVVGRNTRILRLLYKMDVKRRTDV